MAELLIAYLIFSMTTSITAIILLMKPVITELKKDQPLNLLVQYPFLTYFTFLIMGILLAPLLILLLLIPNSNPIFQDTLYDSLKD